MKGEKVSPKDKRNEYKFHTLAFFINEGLILVPFDEAGIFDAMLCASWRGGDGANLEGGLGREELQCAIEASGNTGQNDPCLTLKSFGTTINHWNDCVRVNVSVLVSLNQTHEHRVHVSPSINGIQTTNNKVEAFIELQILILNLTEVPKSQRALEGLFGRRKGFSYGVTLQPGTLSLTKRAATSAFGLPTSAFLKFTS